jgi:hypothetical protein
MQAALPIAYSESQQYLPGVEPLSRNQPVIPILTGVQYKIIKDALYPYHLLTARQITRLLYPTEKLGNFTTIKTRLKALTDAKYLIAAHLPTAEGVRPYVYALGLNGRKSLSAEGYEITIIFEKNELETRSPGWYFHLLELNDFLISAATLEAREPSLHLSEYLHDFTIHKNPPAAFKKDGKLVQVTPDGFLHFIHTLRVAEQERRRHYRILVELDRGSESEQKIKEKIRSYLVLFEAGNLHAHFKAYNAKGEQQPLMIVFPTTDGESRVEALRDYTRTELKAYKEDVKASSFVNTMFKFASVPALMQPALDPKTLFCAPIWHTPYGDATHPLIDDVV